MTTTLRATLYFTGLLTFAGLAGCGPKPAPPPPAEGKIEGPGAEASPPAPGEQPQVLRVVEDRLLLEGRDLPCFKILDVNGNQGWSGTEGGRFYVDLHNDTTVPITVHWHGLVDPNPEDGVPYVTQAPIPPGKSRVYDFKLVQSGTYWMHSHFGLQEQSLLTAPLIIRPAGGDTEAVRDIVVLLNDITFQDPRAVFAALRDGTDEDKLKAAETYVNLQPVASGISAPPDAAAPAEAPAPAQPPAAPAGDKVAPAGTAPVVTMAMLMDLNDVAYNTYTANRRTLDAPEVFPVKPGEKIRLRLINGSSATNFYISTGALSATLVATDGEPCQPLTGNLFQLAVAQRADLIVEIPASGGPYPILFQGEGTKLLAGVVLTPPGTQPESMSSVADTTAMAFGTAQQFALKAVNPLPKKPVDRKLEAVLGGDMAKYIWTINGQAWPDITPLTVKEGERVEINMINNTGMAHPMHLHGHIFQVTEINGTPVDGPMRDTVMVMAKGNVKIQFDADNPGYWAFHCHILYHLAAGMFTIVAYEGYDQPAYQPAKARGEVEESIPNAWFPK